MIPLTIKFRTIIILPNRLFSILQNKIIFQCISGKQGLNHEFKITVWWEPLHFLKTPVILNGNTKKYHKGAFISMTTNWDTKFAKEGITFDDVLLIPAESHVLPNDVDLRIQLADNLKLNVPFSVPAWTLWLNQKWPLPWQTTVV